MKTVQRIVSFSAVILLLAPCFIQSVTANDDALILNARDLANTITVTTGANSMPDLVEQFITFQGDYSVFTNSSSQAGLNYLGVQNAVRFQYNASPGNYQATLTSSVTSLNRTFVGSTPDELYQHVKDFLISDGSSEWAEIVNQISRRSAASISDGNPMATTALSADSTFRNATGSLQEALDALDGTSTDSPKNDLSFGLNGGQFKVTLPDGRELTGKNYNLEIPYKHRFNDRIGFTAVMPLGYTDLANAKIYQAGLYFGLPIQVMKVKKEVGTSYAWQLTPTGGALARGSYDLASGTALYHLGLSSSFTLKLADHTLLTMGNQYNHYESFEVQVDKVKVDPRISQEIIKNGLRLTQIFGPGDRWVGQLFYVHTLFLKEAAVDNYHSFGGGISYRFSKKISVGLNANYDFADNFRLWNVGIGSAWSF